MSLDLSSLNSEQKKAVITVDKPVLLLAGAGSGKTRVIIHRIAHLIENCQVPAHRILTLTFTNKAATEIKSRSRELLKNRSRGLTLSTFHSLCLTILRSYIDHLGFGKNFVIFDTTSQQAAFKAVFEEVDIDEQTLDFKAAFFEILKAKGEGKSPDYFLTQRANAYAQKIGILFQGYNRRLKNCNALDFEDILYFTLELFERFPDELWAVKERYDYIMVDEYQDTNRVQYQIVKYLIAQTRKLCVVGDDDQSIYGWRGADIRNILDFKKDFSDAVVIPLEQNYRSTEIILKAANEVIANNSQRMSKSLWTQTKDGDAIRWVEEKTSIEEISEVIQHMNVYRHKHGKGWSNFAFLYRSNFQSRAIEEQLRNQGIPYQLVGGLKFFDRKEIQDCLAYMRFVHNIKDDVSLFRIINYPRRGIGNSSLEKLGEARSGIEESFFESMANPERIASLKPAQKDNIERFVITIQEALVDLEQMPFSKAFQKLFDRVGIKDEIERTEKNENAREKKIKNYLEFINTIYLYEDRKENASLGKFLDYVSLFTSNDDRNDKLDQVSLMTIHSAKGLEYDFVALIGLEEGQLPNKNAINGGAVEEERRLFYVAMTRAKRALCLSMAHQKMVYGEWVKNIPSRFLKEINGKHFDNPPGFMEKSDHSEERSKVARQDFFKRFKDNSSS